MNNLIEIYQEKQQIKYLYLQADVESLLLKLKAEITPRDDRMDKNQLESRI